MGFKGLFLNAITTFLFINEQKRFMPELKFNEIGTAVFDGKQTCFKFNSKRRFFMRYFKI